MKIFKDQVIVEITWESPSNCLETDGTGLLSYTIKNLWWHVEKLEMTPSDELDFMGRASGGVRFPYRTWILYNSTPLFTGQQDITIPHNSDALDGFISIMQRTDQASDPTVDDTFLNWPLNNATQYQLKVNNDWYPIEPTLCNLDPQAYLQFLRMIDKWSLGGVFKDPPVISFTQYNNNRFIIINNLEMFRGEGLINDFSTATSGNQTVLRLTLNGSPPANTILVTFAQISRTIEFQAGMLSQ